MEKEQFEVWAPDNHEIEMHSGVYVNLAEPHPNQILLEDIAFSLSNIARYGGHVRFYTVAQHACLVVRWLKIKGYDAQMQLAGLHHDDPEAYIGDIPRPLKPLLGGLKELNQKFEHVIKESLNLERLDFDAVPVKSADAWCLAYEAYWLMKSKGQGWPTWGMYVPGEVGDPGRLAQWTPQAAEVCFLELDRNLRAQVCR